MEVQSHASNETKSSQNLESPIRWAGSKKKLLPILAQYWRDSDRKYIEAFAGSARLFFCIQPKKAVLNDANEELISALRILADKPRKLHAAISRIPSISEEYYRVRSTQTKHGTFAAAVRFFYLNRNCFNVIYRTSKSGAFNVPFGNKTGRLPSIDQWLNFAAALENVRLESRDFEVAVREHVARDDFVYLDPPYAVANRRVFRQYSATEFGYEDILRLRTLMKDINAIGATFVVSYALSKETAILAEGWHCIRRMTQRNIAGFSHQRRKAVEVIITNRMERIPSSRSDS